MLTSILTAILGAFIGTTFTNYYRKTTDKSKLTFDMHAEFNSSEFTKHRKNADKLVSEYPDLSYSELSKIDMENSISLYAIMRFYQRLWLGIKYNRADRKLIPELFGEIFLYWFFISFERNLINKSDWSTINNLESLHYWLRERMSNEEYDKIKKRTIERLNKRQTLNHAELEIPQILEPEEQHKNQTTD